MNEPTQTPPPAPNRRRTMGFEEKTLKVLLTPAEKDRRRDELVACHRDLAKLEREEKEVKASFTRRKAAISNKANNCVDLLESGHEFRPVQVEKIADYDDGYIHFCRVDTGEEVDIERMSEKERQMPLDLPEAPRPEIHEGHVADEWGEPAPPGPLALLDHEEAIDGEFVEGEFVEGEFVEGDDTSDPIGTVSGAPDSVELPEGASGTGDIIDATLEFLRGLALADARDDLAGREPAELRDLMRRLNPGQPVSNRSHARTLIPAIIDLLFPGAGAA